MGRALILETTFVIDLEREQRREQPAGAIAFLEGRDDARLYVSFAIAGELACGTSLSERARWEQFLAPFHILESNMDVAWEYGRAYRHLQKNGTLITANDLWIAATALAYGMPLVTRNVGHFTRVPGLEVEGY
ncbi:MAG: type II toxin-antitoxin system VapC family toxin [Vicinamibacterales bacterium]